jgi:hypothetical protein
MRSGVARWIPFVLVVTFLLGCGTITVNVNTPQPTRTVEDPRPSGKEDGRRLTAMVYAQDPLKTVALRDSDVAELLTRISSPALQDARIEITRPHEWQLIVGVVVGVAAAEALVRRQRPNAAESVTRVLLDALSKIKGGAPGCPGVVRATVGNAVSVANVTDAATAQALEDLIAEAILGNGRLQIQLNSPCPS